MCVDNRRVKYLTKGRSYEVSWNYTNYPCVSGKPSILKDAYDVVCDDGVERVYPAERFRPE